MRRIILFVLLALLGFTTRPSALYAGTFSDSFTTDPFAGLRWCERWHHVHWDSINLLMSGVNGTSCAGTGCCQICPTSGCVNTMIGGFFVITKQNYTGTIRSGAVDFGLQVPLLNANGEHAANFSVTHPNCHVGYEAVVFPQTDGRYELYIFRPIDTTTTGHPECDDFAEVSSGVVANITLSTSTFPRYNLKLTTQPSGSTLIFSQATLKDNQTGTTLGSLGWYSDYPTTWYNVTAKRFGFGGILTQTAHVITFDNFVGTF